MKAGPQHPNCSWLIIDENAGLNPNVRREEKYKLFSIVCRKNIVRIVTLMRSNDCYIFALNT